MSIQAGQARNRMRGPQVPDLSSIPARNSRYAHRYKHHRSGIRFGIAEGGCEGRRPRRQLCAQRSIVKKRGQRACMHATSVPRQIRPRLFRGCCSRGPPYPTHGLCFCFGGWLHVMDVQICMYRYVVDYVSTGSETTRSTDTCPFSLIIRQCRRRRSIELDLIHVS